jgi:hypothetical protein
MTGARTGVATSGASHWQSNFHDYRVLRVNETPPIEVHLVRNLEAPVASASRVRPPPLPHWRTRCSLPPVGGSASCRSKRRSRRCRPERNEGPAPVFDELRRKSKAVFRFGPSRADQLLGDLFGREKQPGAHSFRRSRQRASGAALGSHYGAGLIVAGSHRADFPKRTESR